MQLGTVVLIAKKSLGVSLNFEVEMFSSMAGRGHGSSGVTPAGPSLVPKRFVWPHGGRRVFLSGSFTRWSATIPMSPVEGFPTIFQVICDLTPGFHQYKFNVDGEWRHDDQQPILSGNFGLVNAILVRQPYILPPISSVATPSIFHMEVDHSVSGHAEANPRMSESDLQFSRNHISMFLSAHPAYELLPESGKVVALDIDLSVKEAFHTLYEQGVSMAAIWDSSKCQFVGVLGAMDLIRILKELGNHGSNLTEEQLETHTIAEWKEEKLQQCGTGSNGRTYPRSFVDAGPHECLKDVALKILQNKVATVPIIHSSSEDGSFPQLLHLASISGILRCICRRFMHSSDCLPILQLPIGSIPLGTWVPKVGESNKQPLAVLWPNASLGAALSLLIQAEVSSIPIVDDNYSLLDIYSTSDIIALVKNKGHARISLDGFSIHQSRILWCLREYIASPAGSYVKACNSTFTAAATCLAQMQALLLRQDGNSLYGLHNGQMTCLRSDSLLKLMEHYDQMTCLSSDSLLKVMEQLANPGVEQLVIVKAGSRRVEGIISLGDVVRFLLG